MAPCSDKEHHFCPEPLARCRGSDQSGVPYRNWTSFEIWPQKSILILHHISICLGDQPRSSFQSSRLWSPSCFVSTTISCVLAVLAEAVHVGEVLGQTVLALLLQVLLVALEKFGSAGF